MRIAVVAFDLDPLTGRSVRVVVAAGFIRAELVNLDALDLLCGGCARSEHEKRKTQPKPYHLEPLYKQVRRLTPALQASCPYGWSVVGMVNLRAVSPNVPGATTVNI